MDNLEKFIKQNRSQFDDELPQDLWAKLAENLAAPQKTNTIKLVPMRRLWQMAAGFAALLVFGLGLQFVFLQKKFTQQQGVEQIVPELGEAEKFYLAQIQFAKLSIQQSDMKAAGIDKDLKEIENLGNSYNELKKEYYKSGNKEAIVSALIQNLQLQVEVLDKKLQAIRQVQKAQKGEIEI
jgi:hypothetical protein